MSRGWKKKLRREKEQLGLDELYMYLSDVKQSTESILRDLPYDDLRRKISLERKEQLESLSVVSKDERAIWLIDYWCKIKIFVVLSKCRFQDIGSCILRLV